MLPEREQERVKRKRLHDDKKTQLATSLLQRYYIHATTGEEWDKIHVGRTPHGKPIFGDLNYNVSKADGVVVLVGYSNRVGIDIIANNKNQFNASDLKGLFSARELGLSSGEKPIVEERHLVGWAYKEAYMKFIGVPDWDSITSYEFLEVNPPRPAEVFKECTVFIRGVRQECYTEVHNIDDSHFVAIYAMNAPEKAEEKDFRRLQLQEIIPTIQEI